MFEIIKVILLHLSLDIACVHSVRRLTTFGTTRDSSAQLA